jgi:hypothetical protein
MSTALFWGYIHILVFVFWLGADVGVFTGAWLSRDASRSFAERSAYLRVSLIVDLLPRSMFAIILPVGLHLTAALGLYVVPGWLFGASWVLAAAWITAILIIFLREGSIVAHRLAKVQMAGEFVLGLVIGGIGLMSLLGNGPIREGWLAGKIVLLGLLFFIAIVLELAFRPALVPFMEIGTEGSTIEREQRYSSTINRALAVVILLYLTLAVIAYLGKVKPF